MTTYARDNESNPVSARTLSRCLSGLRIVADLSMSGLVVSAAALVLAFPDVLRAQDAGTIMSVAAAAADKLPPDLVRLCITGIIVQSLVLVTCVSIGLRVMNGMVNRFATTVQSFAAKPCMMDTEHGKSIWRDGIHNVIRDSKKGAD